MAWNDIAPSDIAEDLREAVLSGIKEAYDENCLRFAPDDLGDNNISFAHNVRENLRFLIERNVELMADVVIARQGFVYEIRLPKDVHLHIYKAPPGTTSVRELQFDESLRKIEILDVNTEQLALNLEAAMSDDSEESAATVRVRHVVIVHFGDPQSGLDHVEVGEPFRAEDDAPDWIWIESLSDGSLIYERPEDETDELASDGVDDDLDDLELRDDAEEEDDASGSTGGSQ